MKRMFAVLFALCLAGSAQAQIVNEFMVSNSTTPEPPTFSAPGAILEEPFSLYLFPETPGSIVRYTLDNSDPSEENGTPYTGSLYIDETTVIRAAAFMGGTMPSASVTHTYIFPADVILQSPDNMMYKGWPSYWGGHTVDMGMDPEIVRGRENDVIAALTAAPSFSIVLPFDSLFDEQRGIYPNSQERGRDWERPASIELIYPPNFSPENSPKARHGERDGFAVNGGVRIRGGWSRRTTMPKHSFRLYFRGEYGAKKLSYALFGDEGVNKFDKFDLRTAQTYSWSASGSKDNTMVREVFSRDTQRDMGVPYTRSRYYHMYLNGQYWGVFQSQERADHWHGASYLGSSPGDYDVIKTNAYNMEVKEGNDTAWRFLYDEVNRLAALPTEEERDALYMKLQGLNPDGLRNPDYPVLLDADNLIQYMLIIFWTGNTDGPSEARRYPTKNWFGIRARGGGQGFAWFAHDSEHSLFHTPAHGKPNDRTGPFPTGDEFRFSNPQWLHQQLMGSNEYRLRFADLVQRHLFGDGALTNEAVIARWSARVDEVRPIILAESARWGDSKREPPLTPDDWLRAVTSIHNGFLPSRTPVVLQQFKQTRRYEFGRPDNSLVEAPLYPAVDAPVFSHPAGETSDSFTLTMQTPANGTIFYTLDGADPRLPGGTISETAMEYGNASIGISGYTRVMARVRANDGAWSALEEAEYFAGEAPLAASQHVVINEINYNSHEDFESKDWVELYNSGATDVDLTGWTYSDADDDHVFAFSDGTILKSGEYLVVSQEIASFSAIHPGVSNVVGDADFGLAGSGELVRIFDASGAIVDSLTYDDSAPWPEEADGNGYTLALTNPTCDNHLPECWSASEQMNGSPGAPNFPPVISVERETPETPLRLSQNHPNPFNPQTTIDYALPQAGDVSLIVYDMLGRQVDVLFDGPQAAGRHTVRFGASGLPTGTYVYRLRVGMETLTRTMTLVR